MESRAEESVDQMSSTSAIVRYDGPIVAEHSMDVNDLAPALLGLSEIVKIANRQFNGDRTEVKVLVRVDTEQKCFQFNIEFTQTWAQQLSAFFSSDPVSTAKDIAEWIGIISKIGGTYVILTSLIGFIKWICKQNRSVNEFNIMEDGLNLIIENGENGDSLTVNKNVFIMLQNKDILKNIKYVVHPLTKNGYDVLQFEHDNNIVEEISSDEGKQINGLNIDSLEFRPLINTATSQAKLKVKKAVFEGSSKWEFIHEKSIEAKIEDVLWLERYQNGLIPVTPGSFLDVVLRTEIELDGNNDPTGRVSYFVTEVKEVIPPSQLGLFDFQPPNG